METAKNTIQKAKIKDSKLEVVYEEYFSEENYSNTIEKKYAQIVHADLKKAFDRLKAHVVCICEQPEADQVRAQGIFDFDEEIINNYVVTGYTHGGSDESAGVTIIAQKLLKSGKVLNLIAPFTQFEDADTYEFAGELYADIASCDHEVEQYVFHDKWGIKQLDFDFDAPEEAFINAAEEKPKKKGRKKKELAAEIVAAAFEPYA